MEQPDKWEGMEYKVVFIFNEEIVLILMDN
jgi:hypothetical protein